MEKIQSFSIRKFSIGVGSIVLTSTLLTSGHALADEAPFLSSQSNDVSETILKYDINQLKNIQVKLQQSKLYLKQVKMNHFSVQLY